MANKLIMENDRLVQLKDLENRLIGVGFASTPVAANGERGEQVQRFVMFTRDLKTASFPNRTILISPADAGTIWSDQVTNVTTFISTARSTFMPGRDLYIKAYCYHADERDFSGLPDTTVEATFPSEVTAESQGYWGMIPIYTSGVTEAVGLLFIAEPNGSKTIEYWSLGPRYEPAGSAGPGHTTTLDRFPRRLDTTNFTNIVKGSLTDMGSTLVIAACRRYDAVPAGNLA